MSKKVQAKVPVTLLPNPHTWMAGGAEPKAPPPPKPESIRQWYKRSTGWAGKVIFVVTMISFIIMGLMQALASLPTLQRLQTFNGALTIPLIGGVWIFGFIFMFLVPSREASFRGQESLEEMGEMVKSALLEKAAPAIEIWTRIGTRVEQELPSMLAKITETHEQLASVAKKLETAVDKNGQFVDEARPAVEALKRIEERLESEIKTGLFEEIRAAAEGVRTFAVPKDATEPDFSGALTSLRKAKANPVDGRIG